MKLHHCSNDSVVSATDSMKKWGIPVQQQEGAQQTKVDSTTSSNADADTHNTQKAMEKALLERIVWVRYKTFWWPALLYYSYIELQEHMEHEMDMMLKAQFAMAIMRQMQDNREIRIARILGKSKLEVIEVGLNGFHEFFSMLPTILPQAMNRSFWSKGTSNKVDLYLDFHRALDQVETIMSEVTQRKILLHPKSNGQESTWFARAQQSLAIVGGDEDFSVTQSTTSCADDISLNTLNTFSKQHVQQQQKQHKHLGSSSTRPSRDHLSLYQNKQAVKAAVTTGTRTKKKGSDVAAFNAAKTTLPSKTKKEVVNDAPSSINQLREKLKQTDKMLEAAIEANTKKKRSKSLGRAKTRATSPKPEDMITPVHQKGRDRSRMTTSRGEEDKKETPTTSNGAEIVQVVRGGGEARGPTVTTTRRRSKSVGLSPIRRAPDPGVTSRRKMEDSRNDNDGCHDNHAVSSRSSMSTRSGPPSAKELNDKLDLVISNADADADPSKKVYNTRWKEEQRELRQDACDDLAFWRCQ